MTDSRAPRQRIAAAASRVIGSAATVLLALSLLALIASIHVLDLIAHFREYLFWGGATCLCAALALPNRRRNLAVLAGSLAVNAWFVAPYLPIRSATPRDATSLRILHANVYTGNDEHARVLELIRREAPDIISLQEINRSWLSALNALEADYPHRLTRAREDNFGIGAWSKYPFKRSEILTVESLPVLDLTVSHAAGDFHILMVHPLPPIGGEYFERGQASLAAVNAHSSDGPRLVIGDLNTTPFSRNFPGLARGGLLPGELSSASRGFGVLRTWRSQSVVRIPIDHVLTSRHWRVHDIRVGADIGSDHLPLIADLSLRGAAH